MGEETKNSIDAKYDVRRIQINSRIARLKIPGYSEDDEGDDGLRVRKRTRRRVCLASLHAMKNDVKNGDEDE